MAYKVVITPPAQHQLEMHIAYALFQLNNAQAARAIRDDARETKKRLSCLAGSLALCENEILAQK